MQFLYQYDDEARFGKSRGELATINEPGYNNNHRLVSLNLGSHTYIFQKTTGTDRRLRRTACSTIDTGTRNYQVYMGISESINILKFFSVNSYNL